LSDLLVPGRRSNKKNAFLPRLLDESRLARRRPEVLVTFIGLVYSGLYLLYVTLSNISASFTLMLIPFMILFLGLAYGVWRTKRFAFIGSAVLSGFFLLFFGSVALEPLGNPSDFLLFFGVSTVFFSLITTVVYSVLGAKTFWKRSVDASLPRRTIPRSSFFALIMVGFIAGGLVVGAFAGQTQARLLGNLGKSADITILQGAGTQGNPAGYFSPANFTVKVGKSVTWSNGDGSTHTVTSTTSGLFDSGSIPSGGTYSHTFSQPGTYQYYCTIHPWMKGTIVVTSG
jgi:plastocyanin